MLSTNAKHPGLATWVAVSNCRSTWANARGLTEVSWSYVRSRSFAFVSALDFDRGGDLGLSLIWATSSARVLR